MKKPSPTVQKARPNGDRPSKEEKRPAAPANTPTKARWRNFFAIDPRSLALFRILIGVLLLADVAIRAGDLNVMYTDDGMFPRAEIRRLATSIWNWSFHFASGTSTYQAALFAIAGCLAAALIAGFGTRVAAIGSWLMLVSVHHRVPPILSGAEILLRMLLFWATFLPLGGAWSVNNWWKKRRGKADTGKEPVMSVASTAILLQMGVMYFFSAIYKFNGDWFSGRAVAGVLEHDFYASKFGPYLLQFRGLLPALTWATLALEFAAAFLLFWPKCTATVRVWAIGALAVMHLSIAAFMEVGLFSFVAIAGLTLFLPAKFWESGLIARLRRRTESLEPHAQAPRLTTAQRPKVSRAAQWLCMVFLIYVLAVNINTLPGQPLKPLSPERWKPFGTGLGLRQRWGMFEAIPSRDGWYVAHAKLKDGSEVDLLRGGAQVDWNQPKFPAGMYPNHYWQKLFREMAYDDEQGFQLLRPLVARFLCHNWDARNAGEKQVAEFEFVYCSQQDGRTGSGAPAVMREQLLRFEPTPR